MADATTPTFGNIDIGIESTPPFAITPNPVKLFEHRARRLASLAEGHPLGGYLEFVSTLCRLQHDSLAGLPPVLLPSVEHLSRARENAMPPIARGAFEVEAVFKQTLAAYLAAVTSSDKLPSAAKDAAARLAALDDAAIQNAVDAVCADSIVEGDVAATVLLAASLQVHFTRLAAALDAASLQPVADGVCPACGAPPVASAVVDMPRAHNIRYCTCSLCATQWNVVRVKCVVCSSTGGISYFAIEGAPDGVKGETCASCGSYVKIFYQSKDPTLEPFADDIATLALDLKLTEEGWIRRGQNPFLAGATSPPAPESAPGE